MNKGIYHNNSGLLAPLDDFPELKCAKTGRASENACVRGRRPKGVAAGDAPAPARSPSAPSRALSFFDKVRKHRIEFFKKNS